MLDIPGPQRRVRGDARAQQRRHPRQIQPFGDGQHKLLTHDEVLGVATLGSIACDAIQARVSADQALPAKLFMSLVALVTMLTRIHHAAHGDVIANAELADAGANLGDAAHDLVAGHDRIQRAAPIRTSIATSLFRSSRRSNSNSASGVSALCAA
ncbi:hypothetical protein G6F32_015165 [Rhizopus arrhizus]|nr:hypothetical protein G6F32_015165 [Rhizopus arrhizus]